MKKAVAIIIISFILASIAPMLQMALTTLPAKQRREVAVPQAPQMPKKGATIRTYGEENATRAYGEENVSFENLILEKIYIVFYMLALIIAFYGIFSMIYAGGGGRLTRFVSRLKGTKTLFASAITGILGGLLYSLSKGIVFMIVLLSIIFVINTIFLIFIYREEYRIKHTLERRELNDAKMS